MTIPRAAVHRLHRFTWPEIDGLIRLLGTRLADEPFAGVIGIARSGLVPAVALSHLLNIRPFAVLDIVRTDSDAIEAGKQQPVLRGSMGLDALRGQRVLVVDDIVGQGLTVVAARQMLLQAGVEPVFATLVVNRGNLAGQEIEALVEHWACEVDGWVIFPWECKDPAHA